ncbi:MAG: flagellar biosynthetic protein FliR [Halopseudomonas aestusnigri]
MMSHASSIDMILLLTAFALSITRIFTFFQFSPIITGATTPKTVRYGIMVALSVIPGPYVYESLQTNGVGVIFPFFVQEIILGLLLAFFVWLPYHALEFSGAIVDTQKGMAMAQDYNPLTETTGTLTSELLVQIFTAYLFSSGLFLVCLKVLYLSYQIVPVAQFDIDGIWDARANVVHAVGQIFYLALMFAAPLIGALLISDVLIAVVARFAPTLNALVFNLPIKMGLSAVFYLAYLKILMPEVSSIFLEGADMVTAVLKSMV